MSADASSENENKADTYDTSDTSLPITAVEVAEQDDDDTVPVPRIIDPVTPPDIHLTPRQQRVMQYLAQRRMRRVRIAKRESLPATKHRSRRTIVEPTQQIDKITQKFPAVPATGDEPTQQVDKTTRKIPVVTVRPDPITPVPQVLEEITAPEPRKTPSVPQSQPVIPVSPVTPATPVTPIPDWITRRPTMPLPNREKTRPLTTPQTQQRRAAITITQPQTRPQPQKPLPLPRTSRTSRRKWVVRRFARKHVQRIRVKEYQAQRRLWTSILSTLAALLLIFLAIGGAGAYTAFTFITQTQARYDHQVLTLASLLPLDNLKIYDSKGVLIGELADQGLHTTVTFQQISPSMQQATVATEDKNFWTNQGVDILRIIQSAIDNLRTGRVVEGGSTITQQLIKNLIVGNQTSVIRKLEEIVLTPKINGHYSKQQILEMYLNDNYYGHQAYGIDAAAVTYFGLSDTPEKRASSQLDIAQSAMLAGIPSNPSAFDPLLHPVASFQRFENVLTFMVNQRYITRVQELDAIKEAQSPSFFKNATLDPNRAPHFTNYIITQLMQLLHLKDRSQLSRSGMTVYTTLDITLQDKIQKIAQQHIAELRDAHHLTNAAEVLIDFHTGAIISLLGSIDYNDKSIDGQFDVATQGYRQPGSSFKPYVYATAFKEGSSPAQAIADEPTTIVLPPGSDPATYTPHNYDTRYHGDMTLRCALQNSLNVPAVRVLQHAGIANAMQTAYDMGITTYQGTPGYSLVLGGLGIRLIDHTSGIGTFANGGVHVPSYAVERVVFASTNQVIYQHQIDPGKQVISPQLAYMMTNILSDNTDRLPEFYDCNVLQLYSNSQQQCWAGDRGAVRPAAAKTGTTQDFRDNWTVGYTTDYVMGVWAGNDDNTPMISVTGVQGAAPIWHDSMLLAEQNHPVHDFVNPGGLERATVTYSDGVHTTDWFLPGTAPTVTDQPTPTPGGDGSPTPNPGGDTPTSPVEHLNSYCPADYDFTSPSNVPTW